MAETLYDCARSLLFSYKVTLAFELTYYAVVNTEELFRESLILLWQ